MSTTFKVYNLEKVCKGLIVKGTKIDKNAAKALTDEANTILLQAMAQTPVETGTLRRSGTVEDPKVSAKSITVEIGFHTDYAADVHENLKAYHDQGKAKFLEDPVNEALPGLEARLAIRIKGGI